MVPVLETARLRLRPFRAEDFEPMARLLGDPQVMRFVGGNPLGREEAWRKMLGMPGLWQWLGYGYWVVERREDGRFIGQTGFADFKRDMKPGIEGIPEMGWMFLPEGQGSGFAAEAASAAVEWADRTLGPTEIVAIIDPANQPSIRLAGKLGFGESEPAFYRDEAIFLFRRPPSPAAATASAASTAG